MLFQTAPSTEAIATTPRRRHKGRARRARRELRLLAPWIALASESLLLAATILIVERTIVVAEPAYGPTTSISSTSNVSTAPPGIRPGDPLSP